MRTSSATTSDFFSGFAAARLCEPINSACKSPFSRSSLMGTGPFAADRIVTEVTAPSQRGPIK